MLPVITRPPRRPGSWGSPFGRPTEIDLSHHPDPRARAGEGIFVLMQGGWYIQCGPGNNVKLTYKLLDDEHGHLDGEGHPWEPWKSPGTGVLGSRPPMHPPNWSEPPYPPRPGDNDIRQMELIANGKAGGVWCDGQNVTLEGSGTATIIQIFSM